MKAAKRIVFGIVVVVSTVLLSASLTHPSGESTKPEKQTYMILPDAGGAPDEIWLRPMHAPALVFKVEGETKPPPHGPILCSSKSEFHQVGDKRVPYQVFECEGGVRLTLTGIDWEH